MAVNNLFGDDAGWAGVGNWWNNTTSGIGNFVSDVIRASAASPGNPRGAIPSSVRVPQNMSPGVTMPVAGVTPRSNLIPSGLEAAGRMGGANARPDLSQAQNAGMSDEELLAWILGGGGGGGGANLSGYNELLNDLAARESGLNTRRGEQEAFLSELFDAAESRATTDRDALAASVQAALTSDAARRATEIGLIRGADSARLGTANAAREALGVQGGADLSSEIAQNQVGGVGAAGSVADRDARIRQSLGEQQLNREISGLVPMEQMSRQDLNRGYEDRLSALASERAGIRAQIAQARAAGGGRGPSVSERLAALQFVQGAGGEMPEAPGVLGFLQQSGASGNPRLYNDLAAIGDRILSTAVTSTIDPTKPAGAAEIIAQLRSSDPAIDSLIRSNPGSLGWLTQYIATSGSAY